MEITNHDPLAESGALEVFSDGRQRRRDGRQYCEAKIIDIGGGRSSCRRPQKPEELVAELEAENAALRKQIQELMLQIQALKDSRSR